MKLRIAFGVVVLLIIPALIALFVGTRLFSTTDRDIASTIPIPAPKIDEAIPGPPVSRPIRGEIVTLAEAQRRTPYTIPVPPQSVVGANITEVWSSFEDRPAEFKQVYIIYSDGLKISIGTSMEDMDYGENLDGPFKGTTVRGITAMGKDPYVKTTSIGTQTNIIGSLSWWVNQVDISLYHPTLTMQELVTIAAAMPDPVWSSNQSNTAAVSQSSG